ncbi:hypothetical protein [Streptomyces crystallinus]|uniref:Uncharacterized protein n=1 Tax=Streptomyces crystallinus TaxID=68191 RepID=A0ABN1GRU0_9ACTN
MPVYHPAGFDTPLRTALQEMEAARWAGIRDLLRTTGQDWVLRTSRTQVLAAAAARAGRDVVASWLREEPECVDAHVMHARVLVQRALEAHRHGRANTAPLIEAAHAGCLHACERAPADPVPLIALLALGVTDLGLRRPEYRQRTSEPMLPPGPWGLWSAVWQRHPYNREAVHRMLRCVTRPGTGAAPFEFARWVTSWARPGVDSALLMLPLYAAVDALRHHGGRHPLLRHQWARDPVRRDVLIAYDSADLRADPHVSVTDLNHLAHALFSAREYARAGDVFRVLDRHFTRVPWAYGTADPSHDALAAHEFLRARGICLHSDRVARAQGGRPPGPSPP